jgi:hypothetical protein
MKFSLDNSPKLMLVSHFSLYRVAFCFFVFYSASKNELTIYTPPKNNSVSKKYFSVFMCDFKRTFV